MIEASTSVSPSTHDLTERLRRLLGSAPGVLVAYLYGSHARGRPGPLSVVDVALLLDTDDDDDDDDERGLELTAAVAHAIAPARADVVVLNDAPLALSYRVLRDGRVLVSRDERARVEHRVRTIDRYLDMAPARRLLAAGTRNRLRQARLVDAEVVNRRLREIGRRLGALREVHSHGESTFLADSALQAQAERRLQLALQCAIDIALHILAADTDRTPEDYGTAFRELGAVGVLETDLADRLRLAAGLRNVLVHAYLDVDPAGSGRTWAGSAISRTSRAQSMRTCSDRRSRYGRSTLVTSLVHQSSSSRSRSGAAPIPPEPSLGRGTARVRPAERYAACG